MDFLSHILVGRAVASSPKNSRKQIWLITLFAILPDLTQIPMYLYLGYLKDRFLWIPFSSDWYGFRLAHPYWTVLWEIPHSFLFLIIIIIPLVLVSKLPKMAMVAYCSHIIIDLFTHTGEWAVKPFFPFEFTVEGFTDAWAWPIPYLVLSWLILAALIITLRILIKKEGG